MRRTEFRKFDVSVFAIDSNTLPMAYPAPSRDVMSNYAVINSKALTCTHALEPVSWLVRYTLNW